jgi:hypothetical protein
MVFDITQIQPRYMTEMINLGVGSVLQCTNKDPASGDLYTSQAHVSTKNPLESVVLTHLTATGVKLDSMTLTNAGHGSCFSIEDVDGKVHIWMAWTYDKDGKVIDDLVRFPYTPGATWDRTNPAITAFAHWATEDRAPSVMFDWANDRVACRENGHGKDIYTLRKASDLKAGILDKPLGVTIVKVNGRPSQQGYATVDGHLYWLSGKADGSDPRIIERHDWLTGESVTIGIDQIGRTPHGTAEADFQEPEGLSLYRDPVTGEPSLLVGMTTGLSQRRRYMLWAISEAPPVEMGRNVEALVEAAPVLKDFKARRPTRNLTSLGQLAQPGWYYLASDEIAAMKDRPGPLDVRDGWLLSVSGHDDTGSGTVQVLYRRGTSQGTYYWRFVNPAAKTKSPWIAVTGTPVQYAK